MKIKLEVAATDLPHPKNPKIQKFKQNVGDKGTQTKRGLSYS
jgi:hypothetical protein